MDDTAGGDNEDALTDMVFYVPKEATGFNENGEEQAAKVPIFPAGSLHLILVSVGTDDFCDSVICDMTQSYRSHMFPQSMLHQVTSLRVGDIVTKLFMHACAGDV